MEFLRAGNFWFGALFGGILVWILSPTSDVIPSVSSLHKAVIGNASKVSKAVQASSFSLVDENAKPTAQTATAAAPFSSSSHNLDLLADLTFQQLLVACDEKREQLIKNSFDTRFKEVEEGQVDSVYEKLLPSLQTSAFWISTGTITMKQVSVPTTITLQIYNSNDSLEADVFEKLTKPSEVCWLIESRFSYQEQNLSYMSSNCLGGVLRNRKGQYSISMHTMNLSEFYDKLYFLNITLPGETTQVDYLPAGQDRWQMGEGFSWKASTRVEVEALRGIQRDETAEN